MTELKQRLPKNTEIAKTLNKHRIKGDEIVTDRGSLSAAFGNFVGNELSKSQLEQIDRFQTSNNLRDFQYNGLNSSSIDELRRKHSENQMKELDMFGRLHEKHQKVDRSLLIEYFERARNLILTMIENLDNDEEPHECLRDINSMKQTIGHVANFYEQNVLNLVKADEELPVRCSGSALVFDSFRQPHDMRWHLPKHMTDECVRQYFDKCHTEIIQRLKKNNQEYLNPIETQFHVYALIHTYWHLEDVFQTRQNLQVERISPNRLYSCLNINFDMICENGPQDGDADVNTGGSQILGCPKSYPWIFDAEKYAHTVSLKPFKIAKSPVTNQQYKKFLIDGGYENEKQWSFEGWNQRQQSGICCPKYQVYEILESKSENCDKPIQHIYMNGKHEALSPHHPVIHVNYYEAEAYCRQAGRRLPTEAEQEAAACGATNSGIKMNENDIMMYPWTLRGLPTDDHQKHANLDGRIGRTIDVSAFPESDSKCGCRQMIGNVWEQTCTTLYPYPGFVPDFPYRENAAPFFGRPKINKGGSQATSSLIARNKNRTQDWPELQSNFTGFRTCAL